ncbi:UDP-N-acetylmuramoylalanine--D-glutamate ligase [Methylibium sp. T29-B]|nr:UDP-N-acetylmuramoylalanine--D-glutamate ligase [Methylibium sp. T29-B]
MAQALPGATLHHGFDAGLLDGVQRVLKSPGLSPLDPVLAPLLARAAELGVPVEGELDLFAQALAGLKAERGYAPKVIAITGTNGKTTTTVMCGQLIERSGLRVAVAGNVGPTMLGTLAAALEQEGEPECPSPQPSPAPGGEGDEPPAPTPISAGEGGGEGLSVSEPADDDEAPLQLAPPPPAAPVFEHLPEAWVLELSSFQLDGVRGFVPDAAVVLNITQDHLDWHGSMPAYAAAKARIYGPADAWGCTMVVNRDDVQVEAMVPAPLPQKGRFAKPLARKVVRFGLDAPQRPGDYGLVVENGMAWLVRALEADETIKRRKGDTEDEEIHLQRLMPADALRIRGRHNAANALAALALATAIGRPLAPMLHGLREYGGEPHRVDFVATVGGRRGLRRQQGHQRRRHGGRARGSGRRQDAGQAGGDPRRRRQGPGLHAAGRAGGAPCARGGADRPRCAGDRGGARGRQRAAGAARHAADRHPLVLRAGARRRCRAAEPGLRQPGHVPQLRAARRGVLRHRARAGVRARGDGMSRAASSAAVGARPGWPR